MENGSPDDRCSADVVTVRTMVESSGESEAEKQTIPDANVGEVPRTLAT